MVNDTTTLNGALSELGETMATNITAKGVSASASDGLTTLAGKILQISGGGGGGSTTLFEDKCDSASGLSQYGTSECVRGSNATFTMTYDSTENAYKLSGTGNYHAMIPISVLNDEDNYTIEAQFKGQNIQYNICGFYLDNRNDTTSYGLDYALNVYNSRLHSRLYRLSSDGTEQSVNATTTLSANTWYKIKYTVDGNSLTGELYDGEGNLLATCTRTQEISNRQMGLFLFCENGATNSTCYVKNIKAKSIGENIFYDDCSSDRSDEYTNGSLQTSSNTNYLSMNYNSNGYYTIQATTNEGNHYAKWIDVLTGKDNIRFSVEVSTNVLNGANRFGIVVGDSTAYKNERYHLNNQLEHQIFVGTTETMLDSHSITGLSANTWYRLEYEIQGTSYTFKVLDMMDNELYSTTGTFDSRAITSSTTKRYGLYYLNYYPTGVKMYRNIKAESLGGGGSDCSQYQTQINNAITYINGSGS